MLTYIDGFLKKMGLMLTYIDRVLKKIGLMLTYIGMRNKQDITVWLEKSDFHNRRSRPAEKQSSSTACKAGFCYKSCLTGSFYSCAVSAGQRPAVMKIQPCRANPAAWNIYTLFIPHAIDGFWKKRLYTDKINEVLTLLVMPCTKKQTHIS
jgi:hypothetical protein